MIETVLIVLWLITSITLIVYILKLSTTKEKVIADKEFKLQSDYLPLNILFATMSSQEKADFHAMYLTIEYANLNTIMMQEDSAYFRIASKLSINYRKLPDSIIFKFGDELKYIRIIHKRGSER